MFYEEIKDFSAEKFKRLTGIKPQIFEIMLSVVTEYKQKTRKHPLRGRPSKISLSNKLLLLLMYYREYRTLAHIGVTYGVSESRVCEIIKEIESILIQDKRFHLPGKKVLQNKGSSLQVVMIDVTESPVERPKKNSD